LDKHSKGGHLDNLSVEFRNDLICSKKGIKKWGMFFLNIFNEFLND